MGIQSFHLHSPNLAVTRANNFCKCAQSCPTGSKLSFDFDLPLQTSFSDSCQVRYTGCQDVAEFELQRVEMVKR